MKIEKKVWPQYFQKILEGVKTFELRLADFDCRPGDILMLKEWDPQTGKYTGRTLEKEITYVVRTKEVGFWSEKDVESYGYQIISFRDN
jgi:sporulation-control protein spo0M